LADWTVPWLYKGEEDQMPYVVNGHPEPRLYHYLQLQMLPLRRLMLRRAGHELLFTLFHLSAEPFKLIPEYGLSIRH
jgi:hypothetical protein